jgi:hypothetical protein
MDNILESYLVKLGFSPDISSLNAFQNALKQAETAVEHYSSGMLKSLLGTQTAIVSGFASVSAAIVSTVDKMAMADQSYRLAGLHMNITAESARKLTMITNALGASIEEITWDPELHGRMLVMNQDLDKLGRQLGPDFEPNMRRLRDMRAEFGRIGYSVQFLGMQFATSIFKEMGLDFDTAQAKLHKWIDDFQANLPTLGRELATFLLPVLKDTWGMFLNIGEAAKEFGVTFTNVVGMLSGDESIQGTEFSVNKLAIAFHDVIGWANDFVTTMTNVEKTVGHFAVGMSLLGDKKYAAAGHEFAEAFKDHPVISGIITGAVAGSVVPGLGTVAGAIVGGIGGVAYDAMHPDNTTAVDFIKSLPALSQKNDTGTDSGFFGAGEVGEHARHRISALITGRPQPTFGNTDSIHDQIVAEATKAGVDPHLALALVNQESGFDPTALSASGAMGLFQLMPATAKHMGVTDPFDVEQNIRGGIGYLEEQLKAFHGDRALALAAYNAGPGNVHKYGDTIPPFPETQSYVARILAGTDGADVAANPAAQPVAAAPETPYHIEVHFGDININGSGLNEHQTRRAVAGAAQDLLDLQNLHDQVQLSPALH